MLEGAVEKDEKGNTLPQGSQGHHHLLSLQGTMPCLLRLFRGLAAENGSETKRATAKKTCGTRSKKQHEEANGGLLLTAPVFSVKAQD